MKARDESASRPRHGEARIRPLGDGDRPWVRELLTSLWGVPIVTPADRYDHPEELAGLVAEVDGERAGVLTYRDAGDDWEVVSLNAVKPRRGVGRALLDRLRRLAAARGATRVWLITTDTNEGALRFYDAIGMRRARVHRDFIDVVGRVKPTLDPDAFRDAIEFEWRLGDRPGA